MTKIINREHLPNILLVDDNPANLTALKKLLKSFDVEFITASSGPEALSVLLHHEFALIIMDVQMPDMDGVETVELIKQHKTTANIPVIFATAHSEDENKIFQAYSVGAVDILYKPINSDILSSKVRVFLDLYLQTQKLKDTQNEMIKKNAELEQFGFIASHDLKAPVSNIISLINLIESANGINENSKILFDKLKGAAEQMNNTIRTLNEVISLKQTLQFPRKTLKVSSILKDVLINIDDMLEESKVDIQENFSEIEQVEYPEVHFRHIIQNLVTNAIKYRRVEEPLVVNIQTKKTENGPCLIVTDNGKGIDMEKYGDKLFGLFERFHLDVKGKGIGLHMIKTIIENYNGQIHVESQAGVGTSFKVYLNYTV